MRIPDATFIPLAQATGRPGAGGRVGQPLHPDQREFAQVRWWTVAELRHAGSDRFEPHLLRALDALRLGR